MMKIVLLGTAAVVGLLSAGNGPPVSAQLSIAVDGLRSDKGVVQLCLTRDRRHFPDCSADPDAIRQTVAADGLGVMMHDIPPGDYALAVIHDENSNQRLDTFAGIPREGFGFSRNPVVRFGPPSFAATRFTIAGDANTQTVRMRYLL